VIKMADEKILSVDNLTISFKTDNGLVKAVRGVSFDLIKGETLCIVGESGSGKSVTSKAIMGILAKNAIVEDGSIMYNGENLLEISEEEYVSIRGHKIGMIFQDPLSSLNPIVRIGKQITEATLINNDKLKQMYNSLISKEYMEYKNIYSASNARINKLTNKYNDDVLKLKKEAKENPAKKEANQAKIAELTANYKSQVAEIKSDTKEKGAIAKVSLLEASKVAKTKVKEYHANVKNEYLLNCDNLKAKYQTELSKINSDYENYDPSSKVLELQKSLEIINKKLQEAILKFNSFDKHDLENRNQTQEVVVSLKQEARNYQKEIKNAINAHKIALHDAALKNKASLKKAKEEYIDKVKITRKEAKRRALEIMKEVGIPQPERRFRQYPFEFSGGMRQRIVIAIALTANPEVLICDEPTTALDVTIQAQILELINKLKRERNLSCVFITHDLGVVANMADRVAVMYAGKIVEYGKVDEIFYDPRHPYTWALLSSIPDVDSNEKLDAIQGTPPNMIYPPLGDAFAARNKYAMEIDFKYQPPFFKVTDTHYAATWLLHPDAPKVEKPKIVSERINKAIKVGVQNGN
jgi:oligopeptide/dipeptide ABC transporter, ATP-binding protein, C-terminal domain